MLEKENKFFIDDIVYIKSSMLNKKSTKYKITYLNNDFAFLYDFQKTKTYRKERLCMLTKKCYSNEICESIKKGDLVKCIINNFKLENGIVINTYKNFVLVLIQSKTKKISKNNVIVIKK